MARDGDQTLGTIGDAGEYTRITYPLAEGWSVMALFDASHKEIVSLAVVPTVPGKPPAGGLTADLLGRVRLTDVRERLFVLATLSTLRWLHETSNDPKDLPSETETLKVFGSKDHAKWLRRMIRSMHPSRRPDADRLDKLAEVALRYLEAQERDRPRVLNEMQVQYESEGQHVSYSSIREQVREAKKAELLIGMGQGRPGAVPGPKLNEWLGKQTARKERGK